MNNGSEDSKPSIILSLYWKNRQTKANTSTSSPFNRQIDGLHYGFRSLLDASVCFLHKGLSDFSLPPHAGFMFSLQRRKRYSLETCPHKNLSCQIRTLPIFEAAESFRRRRAIRLRSHELRRRWLGDSNKRPARSPFLCRCRFLPPGPER